ncbi:MAG TPA: SRPBCC domain-containing protein [Bacteroidales bacterium]
MKNKNYHKTITANVSAEEAYEKICQVNEWWTTSFKGSAKNLNDVFSVHFGETRVSFKVVEIIPTKKMVWLVTDCFLHWLRNKTEWTNTNIVFEISEKKNQTRIDMTHVGLVPGMECYENCEEGWNEYIGESIPKLLAKGKGVLFEESRGK